VIEISMNSHARRPTQQDEKLRGCYAGIEYRRAFVQGAAAAWTRLAGIPICRQKMAWEQ
jgi:hypothetical protein